MNINSNRASRNGNIYQVDRVRMHVTNRYKAQVCTIPLIKIRYCGSIVVHRQTTTSKIYIHYKQLVEFFVRIFVHFLQLQRDLKRSLCWASVVESKLLHMPFLMCTIHVCVAIPSMLSAWHHIISCYCMKDSFYIHIC